MSNTAGATTILEQLGGSRFITMVGVKDIVGDNKTLQFGIKAKNEKKITKVRIDLNEFDYYNVTFYKKAKKDPVFKISVGLEQVEAHHNISVENLRSLFTNVTGLRTSL